MSPRLLSMLSAFYVLASFTTSLADDSVLIFENDPRWLGLKQDRSIRVVVSDQIKDGCWTNAEATKNAVSIELTRSGYKIADDNAVLPTTMALTAVGYFSGGQCVASYEIVLHEIDTQEYTVSGHNITSLRLSPLWTSRGVLNGPRANFSPRLKDAFIEDTQLFLLDIPKNKNKVKQKAIESASYTDKKTNTPHPAKDFWINYVP